MYTISLRAMAWVPEGQRDTDIVDRMLQFFVIFIVLDKVTVPSIESMSAAVSPKSKAITSSFFVLY